MLNEIPELQSVIVEGSPNGGIFYRDGVWGFDL
jgi:hypothetical protein